MPQIRRTYAGIFVLRGNGGVSRACKRVTAWYASGIEAQDKTP
jgi:hypothetical protein